MSNSRDFQALAYSLTRFLPEVGFNTVTSTRYGCEGRFYSSYIMLEKAIQTGLAMVFCFCCCCVCFLVCFLGGGEGGG